MLSTGGFYLAVELFADEDEFGVEIAKASQLCESL